MKNPSQIGENRALRDKNVFKIGKNGALGAFWDLLGDFGAPAAPPPPQAQMQMPQYVAAPSAGAPMAGVPHHAQPQAPAASAGDGFDGFSGFGDPPQGMMAARTTGAAPKPSDPFAGLF